MARSTLIKCGLIGLWLLTALLWLGANSFSQPAQQNRSQDSWVLRVTPAKAEKTADFVGSDTCRGCHESQFNYFSKTAHAKLAGDRSWEGKVHGCESCHGPGRAHVEAGGDKTKIRTFDKEPPKQVSETCLACHQGREEHNNFRRGDHWRNDVGCTDCHVSHEPDPAPPRPGSHTFTADAPGRKVDHAALRLLRASEPQLCLSCHSEQKAQFSLPFRHRVLEGTMKCSDCHNPHGGFETTQLKLTTGADAVCLKCHTEVKGPFVYEHSPVRVEGCAICHTPHGTNTPKLLRRSQVFQLCIECHTNAHAIALPGEEAPGAPGTPNFHNLNTERIRNCTVCHVMVHGSQTHPFFFR